MTLTRQLAFVNRQPQAVRCIAVQLVLLDGSVDAEYISGSEFYGADNLWHYTFNIQSEDIPADIDADDIESCNLVSPFVTCDEDPLATCVVADILCYGNLRTVTMVTSEDRLPMLAPNPDCDGKCFVMADPDIVNGPYPTPAPSTPPPSTPPPSTPAPSTPAPSTPAPSTPAPSTPAPSTPPPSTPPGTPPPGTPPPTGYALIYEGIETTPNNWTTNLGLNAGLAYIGKDVWAHTTDVTELYPLQSSALDGDLNVLALGNLNKLIANYNPYNSVTVAGHTTLQILDLSETGLAAVDITGCTGLNELYLLNVPVSSVTGLDYTLAGIYYIDIRGTNFASFYGAQWPNLVTFKGDDSIITYLSFSSNAQLVDMSCRSSGVTEAYFDYSALQTVDLYGNALDSAKVDTLLFLMEAGPIANGYYNLAGGTNGVPGATGFTAKAALEVDGWTVLVNGATPPASTPPASTPPASTPPGSAFKERTRIDLTGKTGADFVTGGDGLYFIIYDETNTQVEIWFDTGTENSPAGAVNPMAFYIPVTHTDTQIAYDLSVFFGSNGWNGFYSGALAEAEALTTGPRTNAYDVNTGATITILQEGA